MTIFTVFTNLKQYLAVNVDQSIEILVYCTVGKMQISPEKRFQAKPKNHCALSLQ